MAVITEPSKKWQLAVNCVGILWASTFTLNCVAWSYLAKYRSTVPQPNLGRVYPLPYRRLTLYVTKFEYILAGPPMWYVTGVVGVSFVVVGMLYARSIIKILDRNPFRGKSASLWLQRAALKPGRPYARLLTQALSVCRCLARGRGLSASAHRERPARDLQVNRVPGEGAATPTHATNTPLPTSHQTSARASPETIRSPPARLQSVPCRR